jgi:hypothetical protein
MKYPFVPILLVSLILPSFSFAEGEALQALEQAGRNVSFCENAEKKLSCKEIYEQDEKFKLDAAFLDEVSKGILEDPQLKPLDPTATKETVLKQLEEQFQNGDFCHQAEPYSRKIFKKRAKSLYRVYTENRRIGWTVVSRQGHAIITKDKGNNTSVASITGTFCNDRAVYSCEMRHSMKKQELLGKAMKIDRPGNDAYFNTLIADFKRLKAGKIEALVDAEKNYTEYNLRTGKTDYHRWLRRTIEELSKKDPGCQKECSGAKNELICHKLYIGEKIHRKFEDGTFCDKKLWSPAEMKDYLLTHF